MLQAPRVQSFRRQGVACRMPEHVNVRLERQPGGLASASIMRAMPMRLNGVPLSVVKT